MSENELIDKYFDLVEKCSLCSSQFELRRYLTYLFNSISFDKKTVLDIGGGEGVFSFYAACKGANEVICLEPEGEGSKPKAMEKFRKLQLGLPTLDRVNLVSAMVQNFNPRGKKFDIILLHNSINHLDEEACVNLKHNSHAIEIYKIIFQKIYNLANSGAELIISDCSRYNFFGLLKLKNPFAPTIEWHKHQSPTYWAKLLSEAGFYNPRIRWPIFSRVGSIGKVLLGDKAVSYFRHSYFCMLMEKDKG